MHRTRRHVSAAQWSPNGGGRARPDLTVPQNQIFGAAPAPSVQRAAAARDLQARCRRPCPGPPAGPEARRRDRDRDEGVGDGEGRDPLHPLVPAADRTTAEKHDSFYGRPATARPSPNFGKELIQGEPDGSRSPPAASGPTSRRAVTPCGTHLAGVHPREPQRRRCSASPRHSRRGPVRRWTTSTAAALDGRARDGRGRAAAARRLGHQPRVHDRRAGAGVLPDRRAVLLRAPRPDQHRPHALRRQAPEGPRARRPLLRLDPRARAGVHARDRARAGEARRADQDPPQRGRPGAVRGGADLRELERRLRPPAADDADHAERGAPLRAHLPPAREAASPASTGRASTTTGR